MLVGASKMPAGWLEIPATWPHVHVAAAMRFPNIPSLVGQLALDYDVDGTRAVAIPLFDSIPAEFGERDRYLFAFISHEAFHQYQQESFADVETPSEEYYPILNAELNALASLETVLAREPLRALKTRDTAAIRVATNRFVAFHLYRWAKLSAAAQQIERPKQIIEGTAKYVEAMEVARLGATCPAEFRSVCSSLPSLPEDWLLEDLDTRLQHGVLKPIDVPRNRIYPVAATVALLLDRFAPHWKQDVERAGTTTSLFEHLRNALEFAPDPGLADSILAQYNFRTLLTASETLVQEYRSAYTRARAAFNHESGTEVVVDAPVGGLNRSRSPRGESWIVDKGNTSLGGFSVYTIRRRSQPSIELSVRDRFVLDQIVDHRKRITFHALEPLKLVIDGADYGLQPGRRSFTSLHLESSGAEVTIEGNGEIAIEDLRLMIIAH